MAKDRGQEADEAGTLGRKLDQLIRLMDESLHLQRVALLEDGHVLRFTEGGTTRIALSLPEAQSDYVQRVILRNRTFYEARLLAVVRERGLIRPGMTVADVGANIGNHSVYFGRVLGAGRVLAFEPQPHCFATLRRNLELNGLDPEGAFHCMVGAESGQGGVARFNPRNLGGTVFAPDAAGGIAMIALDDLLDSPALEGLGFVKIDVEGAQMQVLRGAREVLRRFRPALWIELLERDDAYAECADFLAGLGYAPQRLAPNDWLFMPGG